MACTFPSSVAAVVLAGYALLEASAAAQCQYEVTAVIQHPGCPPPFTRESLTATAMNSHGHVTGHYTNCVTVREEGFVWTLDAGLVTLTRPPGVVEMMPEDINDAGVVCGTWVNSNVPGSRRGFVYWPDTQTYTELDTLSGAGWGMAHAINNSNMVVGERATGTSTAARAAFVWTREGGFINIGYPKYPRSVANAISDDGRVAGAIKLPLPGGACVWKDGVLEFHGIAPNAEFTEYRAIGHSMDSPLVGASEVKKLKSAEPWPWLRLGMALFHSCHYCMIIIQVSQLRCAISRFKS